MTQTTQAETTGTAAPRTDISRELQQRLDEALARHQVPGASLGVRVEGEDHLAVAGVTSVENPLPVDEHTLFQIGSTTKTYTGTAIVRLAEQGLLSLDDRVKQHVPELRLQDRDAERDVTILQLLNHTSGWAGDVYDSTGEGDDALAVLVERLSEFPQRSPLGTRFSYNNVAVSLAGRVIEMVTGTTYESAVRDLLLQPLAMRESFFSLGDVASRRFAVGHAQRDGAVSVMRPVGMSRNGNPAGGLWSTPSDQLRWARLHMGDGTADGGTRVLTPASVGLMQQPTVQIPEPGLPSHLGISWFIHERDGGVTVEHGGNTLGQNHAFVMVPAKGVALSLLTNSQPNGNLLEQEMVTWVLETYAGIHKAAQPQPLDLTAEQLQEYAGRYTTDAVVMHVDVEDDHLVVRTEVLPHVLKALLDEGQDLPVPPPLPVRLTEGDGAVVVSGEAAGMQFQFSRQDGRISGIDAGGRFAARVD